MNYLDLTFPTPAENLACDEALLECREQQGGDEVLRVWEARESFVVLGYANSAQQELNTGNCRDRQIPILRRCSGGGTVLQSPGCLNYALILKIGQREPLRSVSTTNCFIMTRNAEALSPLAARPIRVEGFTDLAIEGLKFSGNAQRRRKDWLLFHGTFLLSFEVALMEQLLLLPSKQPPYRQDRSHEQFLTSLNLPALAVKTALRESWGAHDPLAEAPSAIMDRLVREKYSRDEWNLGCEKNLKS